MAIKRLWEGLKSISSRLLHKNEKPRSVHSVQLLDSRDHDSLFQYHAGRWLWNEEEQLARRYRKFNIPELLKAGANAVGSRSCVTIEKLVDGNFNKAFQLSMNDGKEIIAKLPNPNAGRSHLVTASEVATLDFVRNVLEIPVPKVLDWCSHASRTSVDAEYIIMEKVSGRPLAEFWNDMEGTSKKKVVQQIAGFESKFASVKFPMYGSLFYADSIKCIPGSEVEQDMVARNFVVGPTVDRGFFDNKRAELELDIGPWRTAKDYFAAMINRDRACIRQFGSSGRTQGIQRIADLYTSSSSVKLAVLSKAEAILEYLLSLGDIDMKPAIWHCDLHSDNIFVDPDDPTRITGIIDWQTVHLAPLFEQVRYPSLIDIDNTIPEGLRPIELPIGYDSMSAEEQRSAREDMAAKTLVKLYELAHYRANRSIYTALVNQDTAQIGMLGLLGRIFDDGEPYLDHLLIELTENWSKTASGPCPISYSVEEKEASKERVRKWAKGVELNQELLDEVGAYRGWDGFVSHADYLETLERLEQARTHFIQRNAADEEEKAAWAAAWPFRDGRNR